MSQTHPVPVEVRRRWKGLSVRVDGSMGEICAPHEYFCQMGDCEADGIMNYVYSELAARNGGKNYTYVPEFHFGAFVPGKIKRDIAEHRPVFDNVYEKMKTDPGYFAVIERELSAYRHLSSALGNGRRL